MTTLIPAGVGCQHPEALIDRHLAKQFFPNTSPLGATVRIGDRTLTIVGVVDQGATVRAPRRRSQPAALRPCRGRWTFHAVLRCPRRARRTHPNDPIGNPHHRSTRADLRCAESGGDRRRQPKRGAHQRGSDLRPRAWSAASRGDGAIRRDLRICNATARRAGGAHRARCDPPTRVEAGPGRGRTPRGRRRPVGCARCLCRRSVRSQRARRSVAVGIHPL